MKRLVALVLVLGGILWLLPGSSMAAKARSDSSDFGPAREVTPIFYAAVGGEAFTKASCTSDAGDQCNCAEGATCVSDARGCRCVRGPLPI
jgi:hypothetical protein